ncbi:FAD:protein FMN transferase [Sneathiella sp.]|uniref:FAD:protein FMN transferase n=1 Tax=Sneathiella sp. TaxID=1964365 RepID=UPI0025D36DE3|nr:FAD:protein FMN transferase [Sneathiella sp.]|tara:strand:- start:301 stop:1308 length:1008 start_codon:yes stop_codon:yes gene_type:complete
MITDNENRVSRRSFLIAASASLAASAFPFHAARATEPVRWKGAALGAEGIIELHHTNLVEANYVLQKCQQEIERLEDLFSLYRPHSALSRLNKSGVLENPDIQFLELLSFAQSFSAQTDGLFDVTIQPLWRLYADFYERTGNRDKEPLVADIRRVLKSVGYQNLRLSTRRIEFKVPDMAITLNGIAQGYITDHIKSILQSAGYKHVLLSLGEVAAIGPKAVDRPWKVGLEAGRGADSASPLIISLDNQAVATSGTYASPFASQNGANHLLNPKTGGWSTIQGSVSVISNSAMWADMYSTVLSLMTGKERERLLASSRQVNAVYYSSRSEGNNWFG